MLLGAISDTLSYKQNTFAEVSDNDGQLALLELRATEPFLLLKCPDAKVMHNMTKI